MSLVPQFYRTHCLLTKKKKKNKYNKENKTVGETSEPTVDQNIITNSHNSRKWSYTL